MGTPVGWVAKRKAEIDKFNRKRPLPPYPTTAPPGTLEKIEVMQERLAQGYHLHHPDDVKLEHEEVSITRIMIALLGKQRGIR